MTSSLENRNRSGSSPAPSAVSASRMGEASRPPTRTMPAYVERYYVQNVPTQMRILHFEPQLGTDGHWYVLDPQDNDWVPTGHGEWTAPTLESAPEQYRRIPTPPPCPAPRNQIIPKWRPQLKRSPLMESIRNRSRSGRGTGAEDEAGRHQSL